MVIPVSLPPPFIEAKEVLEHIEKHNFEAYFVGGCVRDFLLEREIGDIDIATSAPPSVIQHIFERVIPVGLKHGTVIVRYHHQSYEVTTYRVDGNYSDQRHPDTVQFIQTIDQDLKRRDFTINALAMDMYGRIVDLFDGKKDIKEKVIRTVGNGYDRFMEDPLRIIRALRFSSQLGFSINSKTLTDMELLKSEIENIAVERISNEITKLFAGEFVEVGIKHLIDTKVYEHLPVMIKYPYIIKLLPKKIQPIQSFGSTIAMFHFLEPNISINQWSREWKCSNKVKREAIDITDALIYYNYYSLDQWLVYFLPSNCYHQFVGLVNMLFEKQITLKELQHIDRTLPIKSKRDLMTTGKDVRELYPHLKSGPWIQHTLNALEKQVVLGKLLNNKIDQRDWIKWNPHVIN